VLGLVLRRGLALAGMGIALGLVISVAANRALDSLLFGVSPTDPLTYAAVAALLLAVSLLACYLPAWRATRVDPTVAMRAE
jgi:ABC-type antimicrobial peptide transport system permease subunit